MEQDKMYPSPNGISVFFPAFNDEQTIEQMVAQALELLPTLTDNYEVIVVNDGSTDSTGERLEALTQTSPQVRVIPHEKNLGYGAALRTGFSQAEKDLIFYTDGDGQYDVGELAVLLPQMTAACDVVNGYKIKRADSYDRIFLGAVYNHLARLLFRLPVRDVDCDFRLIRRHALNRIELVSSSGVICVELVYKLHSAGCVFVEAPVHHYPRLHGKSQFFTLRRLSRTVIDFLTLWIKLVILKTNTVQDYDQT
jgi:glycosyltransferase involved in cell wall biosynthesis